MPYKSKAQAAFMHIHHPEIAKRWDKEMRSQPGGINKVYKTGVPVAHKNMTLDPTGYINREINKGPKPMNINKGLPLPTPNPSSRRAGKANLALQRAAKRRIGG